MAYNYYKLVQAVFTHVLCPHCTVLKAARAHLEDQNTASTSLRGKGLFPGSSAAPPLLMDFYSFPECREFLRPFSSYQNSFLYLFWCQNYEFGSGKMTSSHIS